MSEEEPYKVALQGRGQQEGCLQGDGRKGGGYTIDERTDFLGR